MGNEGLLKTPLYEEHVKCGGKIVPFAGWLLPVQYETGVIAEHMAVRTQCGLFDVSHMGEITCTGRDALANLNRLLANDYTNLADGQARYSPMCNEQGGVVDDLIVYKKADNDYFIVVNAANKDKDFAWMQAHAEGEAELRDISAGIAQLANSNLIGAFGVQRQIALSHGFGGLVAAADAFAARFGATCRGNGLWCCGILRRCHFPRSGVARGHPGFAGVAGGLQAL